MTCFNFNVVPITALIPGHSEVSKRSKSAGGLPCSLTIALYLGVIRKSGNRHLAN